MTTTQSLADIKRLRSGSRTRKLAVTRYLKQFDHLPDGVVARILRTRGDGTTVTLSMVSHVLHGRSKSEEVSNAILSEEQAQSKKARRVA